MNRRNYLAKNYFDDPAEAKSFLEGINKIAEKSEMRDKGYIVIIGSDHHGINVKYFLSVMIRGFISKHVILYPKM